MTKPIIDPKELKNHVHEILPEIIKVRRGLHRIPETKLEERKTSKRIRELIADTKHGLYVTNMMGFGFNAVTGDFSRGASGFLIRDGELAEPVSEVTISLNLDELFQRIDAVANDLKHRTSITSPSFRVSSMTLAGS